MASKRLIQVLSDSEIKETSKGTSILGIKGLHLRDVLGAAVKWIVPESTLIEAWSRSDTPADAVATSIGITAEGLKANLRASGNDPAQWAAILAEQFGDDLSGASSDDINKGFALAEDGSVDSNQSIWLWLGAGLLLMIGLGGGGGRASRFLGRAGRRSRGRNPRMTRSRFKKISGWGSKRNRFRMRRRSLGRRRR